MAIRKARKKFIAAIEKKRKLSWQKQRDFIPGLNIKSENVVDRQRALEKRTDKFIEYEYRKFFPAPKKEKEEKR